MFAIDFKFDFFKCRKFKLTSMVKFEFSFSTITDLNAEIIMRKIVIEKRTRTFLEHCLDAILTLFSG